MMEEQREYGDIPNDEGILGLGIWRQGESDIKKWSPRLGQGPWHENGNAIKESTNIMSFILED